MWTLNIENGNGERVRLINVHARIEIQVLLTLTVLLQLATLQSQVLPNMASVGTIQL